MSMEIKPLANLPDAERAREILERLTREFLPIARARGYQVTSLSEMCCCGDAGRRGRGRGRGGGRPMSNNVWGYNQSHGRGAPCRISIRLRQPTDHGIILPYENAAGTMAHELAHCVHGNHSAAFYRLMDEIAEQHADYVARGLVVDREGFPMGGQSHTLGGRGQGAVRNATANGGGGRNRGLLIYTFRVNAIDNRILAIMNRVQVTREILKKSDSDSFQQIFCVIIGV